MFLTLLLQNFVDTAHSGNRFFRLEVKRHQDRYLRAKKRDKPSVAALIVKVIRDRGGRFLRRCDTSADGNVLWVDIGDDRAREKTCQALREGAPELRKRRKGSSCDDDSPEERRKDDDDMSRSSSPDREHFERSEERSAEASTTVHSGEPDSEARDDSEAIRGDEPPLEKGKTIIKPLARLVKHAPSEIAMDKLTPREQELYLQDFVPPNPLMRKAPRRKETFKNGAAL